MEIEAKFKVADESQAGIISSADRLGEFELQPGKSKHVHDTYLDTRDRSLLAAGYACRSRSDGTQPVITIKALSSSRESIRTREELEVTLKEASPPESWPRGPARDLVLEIAGARPLVPLVELEQTRIVRAITRQGRVVAEMSLDTVHVLGVGGQPGYHELECEASGEGSEADIRAIGESIRQEWRLEPSTRSKFERALELVNPTGGAGA